MRRWRVGSMLVFMKRILMVLIFLGACSEEDAPVSECQRQMDLYLDMCEAEVRAVGECEFTQEGCPAEIVSDFERCIMAARDAGVDNLARFAAGVCIAAEYNADLAF